MEEAQHVRRARSLRPSLPAGALAAAALALACATAAPPTARSGNENGEWRYYGGDAGSSRYSPLDQIDASNVGDLEVAWRWSSASLEHERADSYLRTTPLKVGDRLYATAGFVRSVVALDPGTGETIWVFTPDEPATAGRSRGGSGRGVAYWRDGDGELERIFFISRSFRLFSLDPETGVPDPEFGENGEVDLLVGLGESARPDSVTSTSPPIVVGDVVVVGSTFPASATHKEAPPGDVRGIDARTGEVLWTFHTIPRPGEYGHDTWDEGSWEYTGNTGAWTTLTADPELGYVYLPLETPTVDHYGGHRPGDNLFAESVVCLDASTGERVWHYQLIHHGIWDYDIPAPPVLADITVDGRDIKALAQVTKQAYLYVFDRVTGEPVWPIEEKPVPQSDVPGEKTAATQPHPTWPLPYEPQGITEDVLIDFTPELRAEAIEILKQFRIGPIFTPPSLVEEGGTQGTLLLPGIMGGSNWPGAALDPVTNILYIPSVNNPSVVAVAPPDPARSNLRYNHSRGNPATGPQGLPLVKPPWGRITAIDLDTGEHVWMVSNGETPPSVRDHPALAGLDIPATGRAGRAGVLVTRTLLFAGEGPGMYAEPRESGGPIFRAFDKQTGEILAELELPGNQTSVPMSYEHDGKQYVVVAVGQRREPGEIVALALPDA
ncbi:MAG TPA: pyrroloquinoline quinone-dependent dehydrogenase [Thermoanaerobaculia bacterium]|nr:pyrroloquinoline quinone-dependent dehydrogenase [Thermoanaerobaculia bacterium]